MKHTALRKLRQDLGLSVAEAAEVLETDITSVRRMERDPSQKTARPAPARVAQLYQAYAQGFRPDNWPESAMPGKIPRMPEAILVGKRAVAIHLNRVFESEGHSHIRAYCPGEFLRATAGRPLGRVTISADVDYHADIQGEGPLLELVKRRLVTFGDQAELVIL